MGQADTQTSVLDAPYEDVFHALKVAYRLESRALVKINPYLKDLRGGTVRLGSSDETPWDRFIGAALVRAAIAHKIEPMPRTALEAHYTTPRTPELEARKLHDCMKLAVPISNAQKIPLPYVYDVTKEWAGYSRLHCDGWWRHHLNVSQRTLYAWRQGRDNRNLIGVLPDLYAILDDAVDRLETVLHRQGALKYLRGEK